MARDGEYYPGTSKVLEAIIVRLTYLGGIEKTPGR